MTWEDREEAKRIVNNHYTQRKLDAGDVIMFLAGIAAGSALNSFFFP